MHALMRAGAVFSFACSLAACRSKASKEQCEALVDRYASLTVEERMKSEPKDAREKARLKERDEAKNDDAFKNCTSEVEPKELTCAMSAATSDALIKCIE